MCLQREPLRFEFTSANVSPDIAVVRIAVKEVHFIRSSVYFTVPGYLQFLFHLKTNYIWKDVWSWKFVTRYSLLNSSNISTTSVQLLVGKQVESVRDMCRILTGRHAVMWRTQNCIFIHIFLSFCNASKYKLPYQIRAQHFHTLISDNNFAFYVGNILVVVLKFISIFCTIYYKT